MNPGQIILPGATYAMQDMTFKYSSLSTSDSGRSDDGVMHNDWVLSSIRKVLCKSAPLPIDKASALINAIQGKNYRVDIFDIRKNATVDMHAYTAETDVKLLMTYGGTVMYVVSFNIINQLSDDSREE